MINVELDLVLIKSFLLDKETYSKYAPLIIINSLSEEAKIILSDLDVYYKESDSADLKKFSPWFISRHTHWDSEKQEYYKHILSRIMEIESDDIKCIMLDFHKRELWRNIIEIKEKDFDTYKIEESVKVFNSQLLANNDLDYLKYEDWINEDKNKNDGYKWRLKTIQQMWGNIKPKQLYLVTAVTHTGKSSFITSEATNICHQLTDESTVLYFNNERSESAILERFLCSFYKKDVDTIRQHRDKAITSFIKKYPHRPLRVFSARDGKKTIKEVEKACSMYKPAIVIIDQLDKLISKDDQKTRRPYENIYSWARDLAIIYNTIVIGATQYGVQKDKSGQVRESVQMSQNGLFDATTDKSANADFVIGIQNVPTYNNQKKIFLLRAKEGEEGLQFNCKFDKITGLFEDII